MQQLDIFEDNRGQMLRHDLAQAIAGGDAAAARTAATTLRAHDDQDAVLAPAALLIEAIADAAAPTPADVAVVLAERARIEQQLAAAARTVLGDAAERWLAARWRALAQRAAQLPYRSDEAPAHAAALRLEAGDWAEAAAAVERIASWRRIPQPLAWMLHARWALDGLDAAWPLLAELAWIAPARAAATAARLTDTRLQRLLRRFESDFDAAGDRDGWAWFPAWALVEQPLLAAPLAGAQVHDDAPPQRAFALVMALLRLERHGRHHELIAHRRQLQALSAPLFAAYMATR